MIIIFKTPATVPIGTLSSVLFLIVLKICCHRGNNLSRIT